MKINQQMDPSVKCVSNLISTQFDVEPVWKDPNMKQVKIRVSLNRDTPNHPSHETLLVLKPVVTWGTTTTLENPIFI